MTNIYVQPLKAYNAGKGGGKWVDIDSLDSEEIWGEIEDVLSKSPAKGEEEWMISDYDDMPNMGENPDMETLAGVVEIIDEASAGAVKVYIDHVGDHYFTPDGFRDAYAGTYKDLEDFGWEMMENSGNAPDEFWQQYIDVEKYASELLMSDYFGSDSSDGFHVFMSI